MTKLTRSQKLIAALEKRGYKQSKLTGRYRVMSKDDQPNCYIGDNGALRVGQTVAGSRSLTGTKKYHQLLEDGLPSVESL